MYRRAFSIYSMLHHSSGSRAVATVLGSTAARSDASIAAAISGVEAALRVAPQLSQLSAGAGLWADLTSLLALLQQEQERANLPAVQAAASGVGGAEQTAAEGQGDVVILHADVLEGMQVNGGKCAKRQGFWSQTVETCTIYIPLCLLCDGNGSSSGNTCKTRVSTSAAAQASGDGTGAGAKAKVEQVVPLPLNFQRGQLEVSLEKAEVRVDYCGEVVLHSVLEYNIAASPRQKAEKGAAAGTSSSAASTWTLESPYTERRIASSGEVIYHKDGPPSHLALHVTKIPSLEWYPGCEWWDRIFVDDEAIDTTLCKVDAGSLRDLPTEAVARAQQEHLRFTAQSKSDQQNELDGLAKMKNDFSVALEKHEQQQRAGLAEQEGRAEMLDAMSVEFPHIFFGTK